MKGLLPKKLDRASTSPSTVVTVKSGAACPTSGPTLRDGVGVGCGASVVVGAGLGDAGVGVSAAALPGSSVAGVGFGRIELSEVESPPEEGTGVPVGAEVTARPETVGPGFSVRPVLPQAARNTPSRQIEMIRPAFRHIIMLLLLTLRGLSHASIRLLVSRLAKRPTFAPGKNSEEVALRSPVLSTVHFAGPTRTELRTFRWEVLL